MSARSIRPWASLLADDLRGLDAARRWTIATGALVIVLGVAVAATGWISEAEASFEPERAAAHGHPAVERATEQSGEYLSPPPISNPPASTWRDAPQEP